MDITIIHRIFKKKNQKTKQMVWNTPAFFKDGCLFPGLLLRVPPLSVRDDGGL